MNDATAQPTAEELTATPSEVFGDDLTDDQQTTTDDTTTTTDDTTKDTKPTTLTADDIRKSVSAGVRDAQPTTEPPAKQYTKEELDTLFNVYKPSEDVITRLIAGGQDGLNAMSEFVAGLRKEFSTLLQYQVEAIKQELTGQMSPALRFVSDAAAAKDRDTFFSQNEDLKPHEALVQTVFNALKAEGYTAKDTAEAYKTLADRTRKLLPTSTNGSGASQSAGARTTTQTQTRRPAALSSGSQAGGGGGSSAPATGFPGGEIFL